MPSIAPNETRALFVPVLSVDPELGMEFIRGVLGDPAADGVGELKFEHYHVRLRATADDPEAQADWAAHLAEADAAALVVHYLDGASLQGIHRRFHGALRARPDLPVGLFLFRQEGEREFKLSCGECGQKLWVREADIGKRGRCAHCRHPLIIPTPSEYLRERLSLPDAAPVLNVIKGDISLCRGALANLLARAGPGLLAGTGYRPSDFLKRSTVAIRLENGTK